ncbi:MAG: bifunctional cobalt-precorrin-7 (C(5))-methyltransferase/cobalt-precorrin-6B (C(15))-methyltransferase [Thermodesulfovibrionales bacterium]
MRKVFLVGIGYKPLEAAAREIILGSGVVFASNRLCEVFQRYDECSAVKDRIRVINKIEETMAAIRSELAAPAPHTSPRITLLASGDPLFFGIGRRAVEEFGPGRVEIIPDLSSMQLAFARIGEPWDNAFLMSVHGGPDPAKRRKLPWGIEDIPSLLLRHAKVAVLTDTVNSPARIAQALLDADLPVGCTPVIHVCERLGYPDERIISGSPSEISQGTFADPNVVILFMKNTGPEAQVVRLGITEEEIAHSAGLITKDEVRAVVLHKLSLPCRGVLWDIGSGSGSVSIEAAGICPDLAICSVERDADQIANIRENRKRHVRPNIRPVQGEAPEALADLPAPDRIFVGGSGGRLAGIIEEAGRRMPSGIIVVAAVTVETFTQAVGLLEQTGFRTEISQISVSRSRRLGSQRLLSAQNPVFVIKGAR